MVTTSPSASPSYPNHSPKVSSGSSASPSSSPRGRLPPPNISGNGHDFTVIPDPFFGLTPSPPRYPDSSLLEGSRFSPLSNHDLSSSSSSSEDDNDLSSVSPDTEDDNEPYPGILLPVVSSVWKMTCSLTEAIKYKVGLAPQQHPMPLPDPEAPEDGSQSSRDVPAPQPENTPGFMSKFTSTTMAVAGNLKRLPWRLLNQPIILPIFGGASLGNVNPLNHLRNLATSSINYMCNSAPLSHRPLQNRLDGLDFDRDLERVSTIVNERYAADEVYRQSQSRTQRFFPGTPSRRAPLHLIRQPAQGTLIRQRTWLPPATQVEQSETASTSSDAADEVSSEVRWKTAERTLRTRVIQSAVSFVAYRFFNETILGQRPDDVMTYYNSIINAENPREVYLNQLHFIGKLLAYILLPIIEWIVGLIFHNKEEQLTGIAYIAEKASQYFSDPSTRDREFDLALETCSNYFRTLNLTVDSFHQGDGGTLPFQQYLRRKLDEDLEVQGIPREVIYGNAHSWFIEMINIHSGVPIIGGLLDKIIKTSLKPVLDRANVIQSAITQGLGSIRPNSSFAYGVMRFFVTTLNNFTRALTAPNPDPQSQSAGLSFLENSNRPVNPHQQRILRDLFQRLTQFLPYEKVSEENIRALKEQNEGRFGWLKIENRLKPEILDTLENIFVQAMQSFLHATSDAETQQFLWMETLALTASIFDPSPPRTAEECLLIQNQAKSAITLFLDAILEINFREDLSKSKKDKEIRKGIELTTQTRADIQSSLNALTQQISSISPNIQGQNMREIERTLVEISMERKQLFSKLYNKLTKAYESERDEVVIPLPNYTETQFLNGINQITQELVQIQHTIDQILNHTQCVRALKHLKETTEPVSRLQHRSAYPQHLVPLDQIIEWAEERIPSLVAALTEANQAFARASTQQITETTETIRTNHTHAQQQRSILTCLEEFRQYIGHITEANEQLLRNLTAEQLTSSNRLITELHLNLLRINQTATSPAIRFNAIRIIDETFNTLAQIIDPTEPTAGHSYEQLHTITNALRDKIQQLLPPEPPNNHEESSSGSLSADDDDTSPVDPSSSSSSSEHVAIVMEKAPLTPTELLLTRAMNADIVELERILTQIRRDNSQLMSQITEQISRLAPILDQTEQTEQSLLQSDSSPFGQIREEMNQLIQHMADPQLLRQELTRISASMEIAIGNKEEQISQINQFINTTQRHLSQLFTDLTDHLEVQIHGQLQQLDRVQMQLHSALNTINRIKTNISDPDPINCPIVANTLSPLNSQVKNQVHGHVRALSMQLLEFIINPLHLEQLLLRCVFSRLSLEK